MPGPRTNYGPIDDLGPAATAGGDPRSKIIKTGFAWAVLRDERRVPRKPPIEPNPACRAIVALSRSVTKRHLTSGNRRCESWTGSPVEAGAMKVMAATTWVSVQAVCRGALGQVL